MDTFFACLHGHKLFMFWKRLFACLLIIITVIYWDINSHKSTSIHTYNGLLNIWVSFTPFNHIYAWWKCKQDTILYNTKINLQTVHKSVCTFIRNGRDTQNCLFGIRSLPVFWYFIFIITMPIMKYAAKAKKALKRYDMWTIHIWLFQWSKVHLDCSSAKKSFSGLL